MCDGILLALLGLVARNAPASFVVARAASPRARLKLIYFTLKFGAKSIRPKRRLTNFLFFFFFFHEIFSRVQLIRMFHNLRIRKYLIQSIDAFDNIDSDKSSFRLIERKFINKTRIELIFTGKIHIRSFLANCDFFLGFFFFFSFFARGQVCRNGGSKVGVRDRPRIVGCVVGQQQRVCDAACCALDV